MVSSIGTIVGWAGDRYSSTLGGYSVCFNFPLIHGALTEEKGPRPSATDTCSHTKLPTLNLTFRLLRWYLRLTCLVLNSAQLYHKFFKVMSSPIF